MFRLLYRPIVAEYLPANRVILMATAGGAKAPNFLRLQAMRRSYYFDLTLPLT